MDRRSFLLSSVASSLPAAAWRAGEVAHLLPAVSDRRLLLKASFTSPLAQPPKLQLDSRQPVPGTRSDSHGFFWAFDIDGLEPSHPYRLRLLSSRGKPLCDDWPLRTYPSPQDRPRKLRLGIYTCAGGHEEIRDPQGRAGYLPLSTRRRLLERMLSFSPDAVIAIGDHVYWDQRSIVANQNSYRNQQQTRIAGEFNRSQPIFGTPNEQVLLKAVNPQIPALYGTMLRSTPVYFVQDDHDYFDNDEASDQLITFPPDAFMLRAGRATRRLCYPEFLPDPNRPGGLEPDGGDSECFGTLRYGRLAELLIYDCRRHLSLGGPSARYVPDTAEQWLYARTRSSDTRHLAHIPSLPFGWSAGKWGDWYPDVLDSKGKLNTRNAKPYWQTGWGKQHDRILQSLAANRERTPLIISGDLHSHAMGRIRRSGSLDLSTNPPLVMIAGPIGTGVTGWPSSARNTLAQPAEQLEMDTRVPVVEHNGFTIADFDEESIELRLYGWKQGSSVESIDRLEPYHTERIAGPSK